MSTRNHILSNDEYYHIYNRGNSKQLIFLDEQDYRVFQNFLYLMNMERRIVTRDAGDAVYTYPRDKELVHIGAYCLMPNHFHLLLVQKVDQGISKFMLKLSTAYTMYFNKKYKRSGGLYEGKFKSKHVDDDTYLRYLYSYIHLNPLKLVSQNWKEEARHGKFLEINTALKYRFSSVNYYLGNDVFENKILDTSSFPDYFANKEAFLKEITTWIKLGDF